MNNYPLINANADLRCMNLEKFYARLLELPPSPMEQASMKSINEIEYVCQIFVKKSSMQCY